MKYLLAILLPPVAHLICNSEHRNQNSVALFVTNALILLLGLAFWPLLVICVVMALYDCGCTDTALAHTREEEARKDERRHQELLAAARGEVYVPPPAVIQVAKVDKAKRFREFCFIEITKYPTEKRIAELRRTAELLGHGNIPLADLAAWKEKRISDLRTENHVIGWGIAFACLVVGVVVFGLMAA